MPKVRRKDIPRPLFAHLLQRIQERSIDAKSLESLAAWLDTQPEVPGGEWFKRFDTMTVLGPITGSVRNGTVRRDRGGRERGVPTGRHDG